MNLFSRFCILVCSATLSGMFSVTPALAQSADSRSFAIEEIIVTAQKRTENSQDIPISINAFSGEMLGNLGIAESDELGQFIPGLEIGATNGEGSQLIIFLRGAGLNDFNSNNIGPIGVYSDDVFISSPALTAFQLFDAERVEVLKGPQGTLYGRNTTGGAIKFIANKPTDEFAFSATGSFSEFRSTDIDAAVSGPISDRVNARLAINKVDSEGFGRNLVDGSRTNGVDTLSYRGFLDINLTETASILVNVHGTRVQNEGAAYTHLGLTSDGTTPCPIELILQRVCVDALGYNAPQSVFEGNYNNLQDIDLESLGGYIQADVDFGNVTLTSVTAYDDLDRIFPEETDASPNSLIEIAYDVASETFSQELRASGGNEQRNWLIGLYYLTENLDQNQTVDLFGTLRAFTGGLSDPSGSVTGAPILFSRSINSQESESFAIFGQTDFALSDRLTLTVGGRYTDEERKFSARGQLEDPLVFGPSPFVLYNAPNLETTSDAFSWRVALDYVLPSDILAYASASRGFKSGGFNGGFLSLDPIEAQQQLRPFEPEFLTAYEIGLKSDLFQGRLRLNAAVYLNDFSDLQVFTLVNTGALPLNVLDNASDAEVTGLEFELVALPTDSVTVALSGAFTNSELKNFRSSSGTNFSGNRIAFTPETSLTGLIAYTLDVGSIGTLTAHAAVSYKSEQFFSTENSPLIGEDSYTLANTRIQFDHSSEKWHLAIFADNVTDETYRTFSFDVSDFGFNEESYAPPRIIGIEFGVDF